MYNRMVNADHIFSLFGSGDDLDGNPVEKSYLNFKQTPLYWVGMFKKTVLNHVNFNKKIIKFLQKSNQELTIHEIQEAGEYVIYYKAWAYIRKIDLSEKSHLLAVDHYSDEFLDTPLKMAISFFEEKEEYEKCAHLKRILDYFSI